MPKPLTHLSVAYLSNKKVLNWHWSVLVGSGFPDTAIYRDGSLHVPKGMTGFADFLTRLKALNPALDLSSFPSAWPTQWERTPEKLGPVNRFFGGTLFPLIVVVMLVYLASQTLLGK